MPGNSLAAWCPRILLLYLAPCGFAQDVIERFGDR